MNEHVNGRERIGLRELARRLDRSPSYVHGLKTRGVLIFGPDGKINEGDALAAIAAVRDPSKFHPREAPSTNGSAYMRARTSREFYSAQLAELDYEERVALLIDAKAARDAQLELAHQVRRRMTAIADRLAAVIAVEANPARVRDILAREIRLALREAAE